MAKCHPDRKHYAKDFCLTCYRSVRWELTRNHWNPIRVSQRAKCIVQERRKAKDYYAKTKGRHPEKLMCWRAMGRARSLNVPFSLTPEDIVIPSTCPILGCPLVLFSTKRESSPSLDRKDNTKGYTPDNVWVVSHKANVMKNNASSEELLKFAEWVRKTYA